MKREFGSRIVDSSFALFVNLSKRIKHNLILECPVLSEFSIIYLFHGFLYFLWDMISVEIFFFSYLFLCYLSKILIKIIFFNQLLIHRNE